MYKNKDVLACNNRKSNDISNLSILIESENGDKASSISEF